MFYKDFEIDNSTGFSHLRISSVPRFNFYLNLTSVQVYKLTAQTSSELFSEIISSNVLIGTNPNNHYYFDIPLKLGKYKVSVSIAQMNEIKDVDDITAQLVNQKE